MCCININKKYSSHQAQTERAPTVTGGVGIRMRRVGGEYYLLIFLNELQVLSFNW